MSSSIHETLRLLLCDLGNTIRDAVLTGRTGLDAAKLSQVAAHAGGDTIYAVDKFSEDAILAWFRSHWPAEMPVQIVMEGLDEECCFPESTNISATDWKCIIDPIDGTRGIMYDKRSAWALAGIAPQNGSETMLSHIVAAAMTEIPTTKQWRADQFSTTVEGDLIATARDIRAGGIENIHVAPSAATSFDHGFSSMVKFFPEGRTLTAQIEERLWDQLVGANKHASPVIFDDQYLSTGGQFHEMISGHDRMIADLRPLIHRTLDLESSLACHPYDCCSWLVLQKSGVLYEHPLGGFPDAPLDTESGVAWVAYANPTLANLVRPTLKAILDQFLA
jgi:hypothetical protein